MVEENVGCAVSVFKARVHPARGDHQQVTIFAARGEDQTFANCGKLLLRADEMDAFTKVLSDGGAKIDYGFVEAPVKEDMW